MTTLAEAVAKLGANPEPVLCLDTCDFLDVIRGFEEDGNNQSAMVRKLVDLSMSDEKSCQTVITYLVRHEWGQNAEVVATRASTHLRETDQRVERVLDSCSHVDIASVGTPGGFSGLPLIQGLVELAGRMMDRAILLEKDDLCIERALARVMDRRRPSHKGEIKDSIHLEHYLEFSRRLGRTGFPEPRLFVSANKADFWDGPPQIHRDLRGEFDDAGLQFFGKLDAALGRLGI